MDGFINLEDKINGNHHFNVFLVSFFILLVTASLGKHLIGLVIRGPDWVHYKINK